MSVSVVIPCRNAGATIMNAIASVQSQCAPGLQIETICVDDGSTDSTNEKLAGLARAKAITFLQHSSTKGAPTARNAGLQIAQGQYVQFLDADDVIQPGKLQRQAHGLSESGADFVAGAYKLISMDGQFSIRQPEQDVWAGLIASRLGKTSSNLFRTDTLIEIGGWSVDQESSQEYELMFRLLQHRGVDEPRVVLDRTIGTDIITMPGSISVRTPAANAMRFLELRKKIIAYLEAENGITTYRKQCYKVACQLAYNDIRPREA